MSALVTPSTDMPCAACARSLEQLEHCFPEAPPRTDSISVGMGIAKVNPPIMPPLEVREAHRAAPPETFKLLMAEVKARAGTKGRRTIDVRVVLDDGEWTETHFPQPPKITRRKRRR